MTEPRRGENLTQDQGIRRSIVELDLDGTGFVDVDTGVPFFDHMLTSLAAKPASTDRQAKATSRFEGHHTIETPRSLRWRWKRSRWRSVDSGLVGLRRLDRVRCQSCSSRPVAGTPRLRNRHDEICAAPSTGSISKQQVASGQNGFGIGLTAPVRTVHPAHRRASALRQTRFTNRRRRIPPPPLASSTP